MTRVFLALKWRLMVNGMRRTSRSAVGALGLIVGALTLTAVSTFGVVAFVGLRDFWDPVARVRIVVVGIGALVIGWWVIPLLTGGVDETVDPTRLVLLPLRRRQLRRGQIAAGLLGPAPLVGISWCAALVVGMGVGLESLVVAVASSVTILVLALVGSRALATSLALASRSRRGADVASVIVAMSGAAIFSAVQLLRFVEPSSFDPVVRVIRWTPPGWVADAVLAGRNGDIAEAAGRLALTWAFIAVLASWWSEGLDRLLTDPGTRGSGRVSQNDAALPLFVGPRSRLPRTPPGASVAREMIYLVRQPGRRVGLLTGSALGLVYLVAIVAGGSTSSPLVVLGAPVAMLFSVQYASNQLGVDSDVFWLEVVAAPPPSARWAGRWLLATVSVLVPVTLAGVATAWWSGGWTELVAMMVATLAATPTVVTVGSVVSIYVAVPVPDSGNPFASNQSADARGCVNGLVSLAFVLMIGILVLPVEGLLVWSLWGRPLVSLTVVVAAVAVNLALSRWAARTATSTIIRRELDVVELLDQRAHR